MALTNESLSSLFNYLKNVDIEKAVVNEDILANVKKDLVKNDDTIVQENLFVQTVVTFIVSSRPWSWNKEIFEGEFKKILKLFKKIYQIDDETAEELIDKANKSSAKYSYGLDLKLIEARGLKELDLKGKIVIMTISINDTLLGFILLEEERNFILRWFTKHNNYPKQKKINLPLNLVEQNKSLTINLLTRKPIGKNVDKFLPHFTLAYFQDAEIIGSFAIPLNEIDLRGLDRWIDFGEKVKLNIEFKWTFTETNLAKKRNVRANTKLHYKMLYYYICYRSKRVEKDSFNDMTNCNSLCPKNINQITEETSANQTTTNEINFLERNAKGCFSQIQLDISGKEDGSQVCYCSEWCNWYSFYFHNPLFCILIVQHRKLFSLSPNLIMVNYFLKTAKLLIHNNIPCFKLLFSSWQNFEDTLKETTKDEKQANKTRILLKSYAWLRAIPTTSAFQNNKNILSDEMHLFSSFADILHHCQIYNKLSDTFLEVRLTFLFYQIIELWIENLILKSPVQITQRSQSFFAKRNEVTYNTQRMADNTEKAENLRKSAEMLENSTSFIIELFEYTSRDCQVNIHKFLPLSDSQAKMTEKLSHVHVVVSVGYSILHMLNDAIELHARSSTHKYVALQDKEAVFFIGLSYLVKTLSRDSSFFTFAFVDEETVKPRVDLFRKLFTLKVYCWAYQIQQKASNLFASYYDNFFNSKFLFCKLQFFSKNDWIENVKSNGNELFKSLDIYKSRIREALSNFISEFWKTRKNIGNCLTEAQLINVFLESYKVIKMWNEQNREVEVNYVLDIIKVSLKEINTMVSQLIEEIKDLCLEESSENSQAQQEIGIWIMKAVSYNISGIALSLARELYHLCKESEGTHKFAVTMPGWNQFLDSYKIFTSHLKEVSQLLSSLEKSQIENCLTKTELTITQLFRGVYVKLMKSWLEEVTFFEKWRRKGKKEVKNQICFVHITLGLRIVGHFRHQFPKEFEFISEKIHLIFQSYEQDEATKTFIKQLDKWFKDSKNHNLNKVVVI